MFGYEQLAAEGLVRADDDFRILLVIRIFRPSIETEVSESNLFVPAISYANRTRVAHPTPIGRNAKKCYVLEVRIGLLKNGFDPRFRLAILDQQIDALYTRQIAD